MNSVALLVKILSFLVVTTVGVDAVSRCTACNERDEFRSYTKKHIKTEILRKLGLSAVPNITAAEVPRNRVIKNLIHKMREGTEKMLSDQPSSAYVRDDHFQPREVTILPTKPKLSMAPPGSLYFHLSAPVEEEQRYLESASLLLHLPPAPGPHHTHARILVHYLARDKNTGLPTKLIAKEGTWELRQDRGGLVKIDLVNLVRKWLRSPGDNLGLVISAETNEKVELPIPSIHSSLAPYLHINLRPRDAHLRMKRSLDMQCSEEYDTDVTECCLWPLNIDFKEFGWDWILFPTNYEANFCSGDCSLGTVPDAPHTHLLQMNLASAAGPCCSAKDMSPITMLYLDQDQNVVMGTLPGMKVESCSCS